MSAAYRLARILMPGQLVKSYVSEAPLDGHVIPRRQAVLRPRDRGPSAEPVDTPLSLIAEHARYVADRIGPAHVALGSDFDGATIPAELGDAAGLPKLLRALADAGFDDEELRALCWGNWRRALGAWWH